MAVALDLLRSAEYLVAHAAWGPGPARCTPSELLLFIQPLDHSFPCRVRETTSGRYGVMPNSGNRTVCPDARALRRDIGAAVFDIAVRVCAMPRPNSADGDWAPLQSELVFGDCFPVPTHPQRHQGRVFE